MSLVYCRLKLRIEVSLEERRRKLESQILELNENEEKLKTQKRKMQDMTGQSQVIPECPVCLDKMTATTRIYNCKNGHLVCGTCKPRLSNCATCRDGEYICRATAVEQIVRGLTE